MGTCCVSGCGDIVMDEANKTFTLGGKEFHEGDYLSIDGTTGNIYDGQIRKALLSEIPDLYEQIRHGEFDRLNKWMKEHIWQYGCCYTSGEMLKRLTGKTLDVVPFLDYMKEKYADLYGIHI